MKSLVRDRGPAVPCALRLDRDGLCFVRDTSLRCCWLLKHRVTDMKMLLRTLGGIYVSAGAAIAKNSRVPAVMTTESLKVSSRMRWPSVPRTILGDRIPRTTSVLSR